jgi:hypothetical protein
MPRRAPQLFSPEQVIFRQLDFRADNSAYYSIVDAPTRYRSNRFERLIARMANDDYVPNSPDDPEAHDLDIPVYRDSYVALRLAPGKGTFGDPAILLGTETRPYPENFYGELRYVDARGDISERWIPNCRLVIFAALFREGDKDHPYKQSLYYRRANEPLREDIDPDIRHPGNGAAPEEVGENF